MPILISHQNKEECDSLTKKFKELNEEVYGATNGKDSQLIFIQHKCDCIFLDINIQKNSALEVLKFIKINNPETKVILTSESQSELEKLELTNEVAKRIGILKIMIAPYSFEDLIAAKDEALLSTSWNKERSTDNNLTGETFEAQDKDFTILDLQNLLLDTPLFLDLFIKVKDGQYIKIFNVGENIDVLKLEKSMSLSQNENYVYFKAHERIIFINFMNEFMANSTTYKDSSTSSKIEFAKVLIEKIVEESQSFSVGQDLISEAKKVAHHLFKLVSESKGLIDNIKKIKDLESTSTTHAFYTTFFAVIICNKMDWTSERSLEAIVIASLFHDIGKTKIKNIPDVGIKNILPEDWIEYKNHPQYGMEILEKSEGITKPTLQIIYQHHEYGDGTGFPNNLSQSNIYPLAKVLITANLFTEYMEENKVSALDTLRLMIPNREQISKHDPAVLKALITSFITKKIIF